MLNSFFIENGKEKENEKYCAFVSDCCVEIEFSILLLGLRWNINISSVMCSMENTEQKRIRNFSDGNIHLTAKDDANSKLNEMLRK